MTDEQGGGVTGLRAKTVSGWLWTMGYVGLTTPVTFLANAVLARSLGLTEYGRYSYLMTVFALGSAALALGYGLAVARFAAARFGSGDRAELLRLLKAHNTVNVLWFGTATALLLIFLLQPAGRLAGVIVVAAFAVAYLESSSLALPALQRSDRAAQVALVGVLGVQAAVIAVALSTQDPEAVFIARLVVGSVLAPLRLIALPRDVRWACLTFAVPRLPPEIWRFASLSYVGTLLGLLVFGRSEIVLLEAFDYIAALGIFALAFGLSSQVTSLIDAATGPLSVALTYRLAQAQAEDAGGRLLVQAQKAVLTCVVLWAALTLLPVSQLIPFLYGESFRPAAAVFLIGSAASFYQSAAAPMEALASALGKPELPLRANAAGFATGFALALLLIPHFGLYGAVWSNVAGQATSSTVLAVSVGRRVGASREVMRLLFRVGIAVMATAGLAAAALNISLWGAAALWCVTTPLVLAALRKGYVVNWTKGELETISGSFPQRLRPFTRLAFPPSK